MTPCRHSKARWLAIAGRVRWCPDCGALKDRLRWDQWVCPGPDALEHLKQQLRRPLPKPKP